MVILINGFYPDFGKIFLSSIKTLYFFLFIRSKYYISKPLAVDDAIRILRPDTLQAPHFLMWSGPKVLSLRPDDTVSLRHTWSNIVAYMYAFQT